MQQTFLFEIKDKNEKMINFYRHGEKMLSTVLRKNRDFLKNEYENLKIYGHSLFAKDLQNDNIIMIYKTDYECNPQNIVYKSTLKAFLEA